MNSNGPNLRIPKKDRGESQRWRERSAAAAQRQSQVISASPWSGEYIDAGLIRPFSNLMPDRQVHMVDLLIHRDCTLTEVSSGRECVDQGSSSPSLTGIDLLILSIGIFRQEQSVPRLHELFDEHH